MQGVASSSQARQASRNSTRNTPSFSGELSQELKARYEEVVTLCCAPGLGALYRNLPESSQQKVIKALRETLLHRSLHSPTMIRELARLCFW